MGLVEVARERRIDIRGQCSRSHRSALATRVGGSPELIVEGQSGELVAAGDAEAMARALVGYAKRPEQARSAGRAGRADVERRFSLDAMVGAYRSLYDRLLSAASRKN